MPEEQKEVTVLQKIDAMQKSQAKPATFFKRLYEGSVLVRILDEQYRTLSQEYAAATLAWRIDFLIAWLILRQKQSKARPHEQKREAVQKHSLPPQEQILSYMGRFINCPYGMHKKGHGGLEAIPGLFVNRK